ncbi:MAG: sensor histidine kinase protein [Phenylobacterium sp.]|nr:sensor histidine kinase protein [Phenylobacterium sp.]
MKGAARTSLASHGRMGRRLVGPALAVGFVLAATVVRGALGHSLTGLSVFSLFYPAILGSALVGGELSAAIALVLSFGASWMFLRNTPGAAATPVAIAFNLLLFVCTGAFIGAVGSRLRTLLRRRRADFARLAEREARYRTLFEGVSEGFALLEGIWDETGGLADFMVVEANPALLRMFNADTSVIGRRQSEILRKPDAPYIALTERAFRGETVGFELHARRANRWFDIRLSRLSDKQLAQIVVDITERKAAESRQTELFDELNHRVKNNLAAVSAMLSMQARLAANAQVREDLQKAVDRIQTIADVHASLYRASSKDEVDFGSYLQRLCERLSSSLLDSDRVRMEVAADPAMVPLERAVALGLVVNELVTNAAKYAYPPPDRGVIRVRLDNTPDGLVLSVSDEGRGLPRKPVPNGLGMRLVRSLVQQCRGELETLEGPGLTFKLTLRGDALPSPDSAQSQLL